MTDTRRTALNRAILDELLDRYQGSGRNAAADPGVALKLIELQLMRDITDELVALRYAVAEALRK